MKLSDAIKNVDRSTVSACDAPTEKIYESLGLVYDYNTRLEHARRFVTYPIYNWRCTDEHVGMDAIYLDDEPVGCAWRSARKSSYLIRWLSQSAGDRARSVILEYAEQHRYPLVPDLEEIEPFFHVDYVCELLTDHGFFEGRPVKVLIKYDNISGRSTPPEFRRPDRSYTLAVNYDDPESGRLLIQDGDGHRLIPIHQFLMPINVTPVDE